MGFKSDMRVLKKIWEKSTGPMNCPQCNGILTIVQVQPTENSDTLYSSYKTVIECSSCSFRLTTNSFTILGSIKDFDSHFIEIASWSPSGSRTVSRYEHVLNYSLLQKLKKSCELVEFLIVNKQIVQII
jgi:transposase-like protein